MSCPDCHSSQVQPSRRGNQALPGPLRWLLVVLRCHDCGRKFVRARWSARRSAAAAQPAQTCTRSNWPPNTSRLGQPSQSSSSVA